MGSLYLGRLVLLWWVREGVSSIIIRTIAMMIMIKTTITTITI